MKLKHFKEFLNEIRITPVSGTKAGFVDSLEDRKYELKKDVKGARIGDFTNVTLPKGTIIYNLPGGVFADHISLKQRYTSKSSQEPQWFDKPTFKGVSIRQMPDTLAAIEKNSKVLESVKEATVINPEDMPSTKGTDLGKSTVAGLRKKMRKLSEEELDDFIEEIAFAFDLIKKH